MFSNLAIFGYGPGKIYLFIFLDITLPFLMFSFGPTSVQLFTLCILLLSSSTLMTKFPERICVVCSFDQYL